MKTTRIPRQLTRLRKALLGKTTASLAAGLALLAVQTAHAASATWNATPGDANWATGANWTPTTAPGALGTTTNADTATFLTNTNGNGTTNPVVIDATRNIKSITFGATSATPASFTIGTVGGEALHLSSGGSILIGNISGTNITETVNAPLVLESLTSGTAGTYAFNNGSGTASNILVIGGAVTGGTTSAGITLTLTGGAGSQANEVKGIISDGGAAGGVAIAKTGATIWKLSGANTYTGGTTITGGTVSVGSTDNLGASSSALTFDGGTLQITGTTLTSMSGIGHTVNYNAGKTVGLDINSAANTFVLDQALNATSALSKAGGGTLELTGANNYSGTTTLSAGTLKLSGTNNTAGATTLTGGTIQFNNATNGGLASGTLTMGSAALQSLLANQTIGNNIVLNGTTVVSGSNSVTFSGSFTNTGSNRTLTNNLGVNTLTLSGLIYLSDSISTGRVFTISGAGATAISGVISNANGAGVAGGLTLSNTGTTTLSNTNTYTGVTTIGANTSAIVSVSTIGDGDVAGNLGAASNAASNLVFNGGTTLVNASTLLYTGATASTDRNFTLTTGSFGGFNISNAATNLTLTGGAAATTGGFVKSGAGTLTFAGANSYTGTTTINAGTLVLSASGAIGTGGGSAITIGNGGTLSQTVTNAITGTSSLALSSSGTASTAILSKANNFTGAITLSNNANNVLTLADTGAIASASAVTLTNGTINLLSDTDATFSNPNITFTGGTINVGNNGSGSNHTLALSNGVVGASNGRTLTVTGSNGYSLSLPSFTVATGANVSDTLNPVSANVIVTSVINPVANTTGTNTVTLAGATTGNQITGTIANSTGGALTAINTVGLTGTWTLSGNNTYTGKTTISAGTLQFAKTASLYNSTTGSWTAANITVASGATLALNVGGSGEFAVSDVNTLLANLSVASSGAGLQTGARIGFNTSNAAGGIFTQGNVIANSTGTGGAIGLTKLGSGTLVLDKVNTYTGQTTVNQGTLAMGVNNAFSAGTNFNLAGGTLAVGTFSNNSVGTLALTANSTITLGSGGLFIFANSKALDWASYSLSITGSFVDGSSIRFGTDASGLTGDQLARISINGAGATLDGSGYLVASVIPEPATYAFLGGAVVLLGAGCVRRRRPVLA